MTAPAIAAAELLGRRMQALAEADLDAREWDETFIRDVCFRAPTGLSPRQAHMIVVLCWKYRAHLPIDLVPDAEPRPLKAPRP